MELLGVMGPGPRPVLARSWSFRCGAPKKQSQPHFKPSFQTFSNARSVRRAKVGPEPRDLGCPAQRYADCARCLVACHARRVCGPNVVPGPDQRARGPMSPVTAAMGTTVTQPCPLRPRPGLRSRACGRTRGEQLGEGLGEGGGC